MDRNSLKEPSSMHREEDMHLHTYTGETSVPYHWHDEFEFLIIDKGSCACRVEDEEYILNAGQCIFFSGGILHSIYSCNMEPFHYFAVVFHPYTLYGTDCSRYFSPQYSFQRIYDSKKEPDSKIINSLYDINDLAKDKPFAWELKVKHQLLNIFIEIFDNSYYTFSPSGRAKNTSNDQLEKALQYIHTNFSSKITIENLSELLCYSPSYVNRFFREHMGRTPTEYIVSYRIHKARALLEETNISVLDAALDTGFNNVGYFIKSFKKQTGITPLKYKNTVKKKNKGLKI
ncbi:MAG: AraC family transcriptional regulator [Bacillota bacterium]|nr:AraC family transcriptional regulator [Bacillota bacterium]